MKYLGAALGVLVILAMLFGLGYVEHQKRDRIQPLIQSAEIGPNQLSLAGARTITFQAITPPPYQIKKVWAEITSVPSQMKVRRDLVQAGQLRLYKGEYTPPDLAVATMYKIDFGAEDYQGHQAQVLHATVGVTK